MRLLAHALAAVLLMLAIALTIQPAAAAVIAVATDGDRRAELHDQPGPCVGAAKLAVFIQGPVRVGGCWVMAGPEVVQIAWLDGEVSNVAIRHFRRPEEG
jgi:hypothetical protein